MLIRVRAGEGRCALSLGGHTGPSLQGIRFGGALMLALVLLALAPGISRAQSDFGLVPPTVKITPGVVGEPALNLHAARGEYAPFQVVMQGGPDGIDAPLFFDVNPDVLALSAYEQHFFPILETPEPAIYSTAWMDAPFIADGLRPMFEGLTQHADGTYAAWVDVRVAADADPGDYPITVVWGDQEATATITVYPVDLPPGGSMSVNIPLSEGFTVPHYAPEGSTALDYQRAVNALLLEHRLVPGKLSGVPVWDGERWDFSSYTPEIEQIPVGDPFYAPVPYDEREEAYFFDKADGTPYRFTDWDDAYFVEQVRVFLRDLAAYLDEIGRADDALMYPIDETFWVADEPDNNGPDGYEHLARWTALIHEAGLRVTASRVLPVTWAPGWVPSDQLTDDSHVHADYLDAAPDLFAGWAAQPGRSVSVYLNQYGDIINLDAAVNRGLLWHAYGRGVENITGYAALEWIDADFRLLDPFTQAEQVAPLFGYGVGALVYPDAVPQPSVRLKLLREGVEDIRLLSAYADAVGEPAARAFAACLTPGPLSYQTPPADLWQRAHTALLVALADPSADATAELCLPPFAFDETRNVLDPETSSMGEWEFDNVEFEVVPGLNGSGEAMRFAFQQGGNSAFYWMGAQDWRGYPYLLLDVTNESDHFAELDVAVGDGPGTYLLLSNTSALVPPGGPHTVVLPLTVPEGVDKVFDWATTSYVELAVSTAITRRNGFGEVMTYETGGRTLIIDNMRLGR